jgi:ESS family glutamate:Na+ symporter
MVGFSIIVIGILLLLGKWFRVNFSVFQKYFLPSSIIAGFIALILGSEMLGKIATFLGGTSIFSQGLFPEEVVKVWSTLPGLLISVIFAALFLERSYQI